MALPRVGSADYDRGRASLSAHPAMTTEDDRRIGYRAPIELKVEYKRLNTFFADYTRNISRGGTFIGTDKPLKVGTEFVFALGIPHMGEPLRLRGKVIWTTDLDDATKANPAGMGIEFQYSEGERA
jgi:type IV pilus assembly protein PilZ